MDLPELFVLRHGETEWNRARRMQGGLDSPLTAKGEDQARRMGRLLATHGVSATTHDMVSSPQGRAMATAVLAGRATGHSPVPEPRLTEITMGKWSGLTRDEIDATWPPPQHETFIEFYARAPGAESFDSLWDRTSAFLADLTRPTVVVTHGFTSRFLRTCAMGLTLADLDALPGGQGVVFHLRDGTHQILGQ